MAYNHLDLELIRNLSLKEPKTLLERFAKLSEECGELATELLIEMKASGSRHKKPGEDGIVGEAIDVMLVAISIYFCAGGSMENLALLAHQKCNKWQRFQNKDLTI